MREGEQQNQLSPVTGGADRSGEPRLSLIVLHLITAALLTSLTSGCGILGKRDSPRIERAPPVAKAPVPGGRGGGFYLDDGPGENPPPDLDAIPDAVPKVEPLHRGASRPYVVMGRHYTPMAALQPYRARGIATWYGRRYHGKQTSTGESYDMYAMTAAHTTLPIPSYARVTNLANGKAVVVRVNDRGPFIGERLIDLSYTAAHRIGMLASGSAMVEVESILPGDFPAAAVTAVTKSPPLSREPVASAAPEPQPAAVTPAPAEIPILGGAGGVYLQLGAFGSKDNAENYVTRLRVQVEWLAGQLHVFPRDGLFRVQAGPYANQGDARQAADRIGEHLGIKPMVLVR